MIENLFITIGAQKAGTTWLHSILKKDERLAFCPFVKEVHYFDKVYRKSPHLDRWRDAHLLRKAHHRGGRMAELFRDCLKKKESPKPLKKTDRMLLQNLSLLVDKVDDRWYERLFGKPSKYHYAVDITPDYAVIGTEGFRHMKNMGKNLKLLYILRDPVERAWSGLLQGKKKAPGGIERFLEKELDHDKVYQICTEGKDVGARSDYLSTMRALHEVGLADNLLVKFYDDISEDPEKFIDDVYRHIGLENELLKSDEYLEALRKRVHATKGNEIPTDLEFRLKSYYAPMLKKLIGEFGIDIPEKWKIYYDL